MDFKYPCCVQYLEVSQAGQVPLGRQMPCHVIHLSSLDRPAAGVDSRIRLVIRSIIGEKDVIPGACQRPTEILHTSTAHYHLRITHAALICRVLH